MDGEVFYNELALENRDHKIHPVFIYLAKAEKKHAEIIKEKQISSNALMDDEDLESVENIFKDSLGLDSEKSTDEQINAYRKALEMEKKSIDLYKTLLSESKENKEIFRFLIKEEEKHYQLIEEIIKLVKRPIEWVESAEFGARKPY